MKGGWELPGTAALTPLWRIWTELNGDFYYVGQFVGIRPLIALNLSFHSFPLLELCDSVQPMNEAVDVVECLLLYIYERPHKVC